jgi:hypothetical protein
MICRTNILVQFWSSKGEPMYKKNTQRYVLYCVFYHVITSMFVRELMNVGRRCGFVSLIFVVIVERILATEVIRAL